MSWLLHFCEAGYYGRGRENLVIRSICQSINLLSVDKKNQLDVTFCILYFSSNSCSTCFG